MSEVTPQTVSAENSGSAPENAVDGSGSAPENANAVALGVTSENVNAVGSGLAPENASSASSEGPSKVVQELLTQRKKRQEAERELEYWKGVAEGKASPSPGAASALVEPQLDQFDGDWDRFAAAQQTYLVEKAKAELREELKQDEVKQARRAAEEQAVAQHEAFMAKMFSKAEKDPTLALILADETLPWHTGAFPLLYASDVAEGVLHALHADRQRALNIAQLFTTNPVLAARELGLLEAQVKQAKVPTTKIVSSAPAPIQTVAATGSGATEEAKLSMSDFAAARNKRFGPGFR